MTKRAGLPLEDSVAIIERWLVDDGKPPTNGDLIDLIASWRERGEALKGAVLILKWADDQGVSPKDTEAILERVRIAIERI